MTEHFNKSRQKQRRRHLRNHLTKAEVILWMHLSNRQMCGYKFRRQYGVDEYIVDFYCPKLKLAIEVDGEYHFLGSAPLHDWIRQSRIERYGIHFLRITNDDIWDDLDSVLEEIAATIEDLSAQSPSIQLQEQTARCPSLAEGTS